MRKQVTRLNSNPSSQNHNTWVCTQCYPFALEIGMVYDIGSLIYMKKHPLDTLAPQKYNSCSYALLQGQGHRDDEVAFLDEKPTIHYNTEFKYSNLQPGYIEMPMSDAINLYQVYIKEHFVKPDINPHQFQTFLITKLANLIKTFEKKYGSIETYYEQFVKERETWVIERRKT